ncbi:ABC transporter permease [Staphylococcus sp. GSSP0090]|nr:ABC transporter permease [Staphylococcus sp. GSSP0090]
MKKKLLWVIPIVAVLILVLLATAFYPAYNPKPKDVPMAVLNEDNGVKMQGKSLNIGKNFSDKLVKNDNEAMNWTKVDSKEALEQGLDEGKYIGAISIDKNFSKDAMSQAQNEVMKDKQKEMKDKMQSGEIPPEEMKKMQAAMDGQTKPSEPSQPKLKTSVKEGGNAQVANMAQQALSKMTDNINTQISKQNVSILEKNNIDIPSEQYESFANPVKVENNTIDAVKDHQGNGNAAGTMFSPVWMSSMIIAALSFFAFKQRPQLASHKLKLAYLVKTILSVTIAAFAGAFVYVYYMGGVLDFNFTQPAVTATYIAIAILGFASLILGLMVWIGFAILPIFILFLFFTIQSVMLPKAMVPEFYQNYILPWNPFYHYVSSLKGLLYENADLAMNGTMWMFIAFILFGIISLVSALYVKGHTEDNQS